MDKPTQANAAAAGGLATALIASSNTPLLLLDGNCRVISASNSFSQAFQLDPDELGDRLVAQLGAGEWAVPQLDALLRATASGKVPAGPYEMDLKREGDEVRRVVVQVQKLDYGDPDNVRLLMTAVDVTLARMTEKLKDHQLREKKRSCCRSFSIASPTACRSSPACCCRMPIGWIRRRHGSTFTMRIAG